VRGEDDHRPARLDADDLDLLIMAIEGLSAKIDAIENSAPTFTQAQAAQFASQLTERAAIQIK